MNFLLIIFFTLATIVIIIYLKGLVGLANKLNFNALTVLLPFYYLFLVLKKLNIKLPFLLVMVIFISGALFFNFNFLLFFLLMVISMFVTYYIMCYYLWRESKDQICNSSIFNFFIIALGVYPAYIGYKVGEFKVFNEDTVPKYQKNIAIFSSVFVLPVIYVFIFNIIVLFSVIFYTIIASF